MTVRKRWAIVIIVLSANSLKGIHVSDGLAGRFNSLFNGLCDQLIRSVVNTGSGTQVHRGLRPSFIQNYLAVALKFKGI